MVFEFMKFETLAPPKTKSGYLLRSTKSGAELRNSIARVSGAWMATIKPRGWVHASLEMEILGSAVRKWNQLDNQKTKNDR